MCSHDSRAVERFGCGCLAMLGTKEGPFSGWQLQREAVFFARDMMPTFQNNVAITLL